MESRHKTDVIMACSAYCPMAKQYEDGVRISYAYTECGKETHATWAPLGNLTVEWGATYPVRYTYDTQNRRTSLTTFRTTGGSPSSATDGDTTTWTHDPYTGNCLSKTYADGSTIIYTYTPDNLLLRTTYASGKWKENIYNAHIGAAEICHWFLLGGCADGYFGRPMRNLNDAYVEKAFGARDRERFVYSLILGKANTRNYVHRL